MSRYHQYYHSCDTFPSRAPTIVKVDMKTNWAWQKERQGAFPIYKECCHFFVVKKNGEIGYEVDMKNRKPKLLV